MYISLIFAVLSYMGMNNSVVDKQLLHFDNTRKNRKCIPTLPAGKSAHPLLCQFLLQQDEGLLQCNHFGLQNEIKLIKSRHSKYPK